MTKKRRTTRTKSRSVPLKPSTLRGARSQAIRTYFARNPEARPIDVIKALGEQRIVVSHSLVRAIKQNIHRPVRRYITSPHSANGVSADDILEAKRFADSLGGIANAQRALKVLKRLK